MKIVAKEQSIGIEYYIHNEDNTHADVFYSQVVFKSDEEIDKFIAECIAKRDEAELAQKNYVPPEQARIQELEAVIVEKEQIITAKTAYVADLTKQIIDAKLVPVIEKPIVIKEEPLEEVIG